MLSEAGFICFLQAVGGSLKLKNMSLIQFAEDPPWHTHGKDVTFFPTEVLRQGFSI